MPQTLLRIAVASAALFLAVANVSSALAEDSARSFALARRLDRIPAHRELRFEAFGAGGLQGTAVRHTADSVWVRSFGEDRAIALADVRATWTRGNALVSGAVLGALNGGTIAMGPNRYDSSENTRDFFIGAAVGAVVGGLLGSFLPEWHRLNVPRHRGGAPSGWGGIDQSGR